MAAKKKPAHGSKKQFVLGLPSIPAKEVVARATVAGMPLSTAYVYMIRSQTSRTTEQGNPLRSSRPRVARRAHSSHVQPVLSRQGIDAAVVARFLDASLDLGLIRAAELLKHLRAQFHTTNRT